VKNTALRIIIVALALLSPTTFVVQGAREPSRDQGHLPGVAAKITMADGTSRTARLDGVGCSASICSRTFIKGRTGNEPPIEAWLDSIAAIKDTTATEALFVMRDGTERRLTLIKDFRVLYLANRLGGIEKLDLATVRSVDFLSKEKH
jgi:hypothetical protein